MKRIVAIGCALAFALSLGAAGCGDPCEKAFDQAMKCDKVRRWLTDYVDGLLRTGRAERVRAHLAECEACREEEAAARVAVEALVALPDLVPPEDSLARLEARAFRGGSP